MSTGLKPIKRGSTNTEVESIRSSTRVRLAIVAVVGLVLLTLTVGLIISLIWRPESFQIYATVVAPILSGAVFGFVGFVVGQRTVEPPK